MTKEKLAEIEALASAATPGPWTTDEETPSIYSGEQEVAVVNESCIGADDYDAEDNLAFIAAARDAVPALIAEVRRLWKENERLIEGAPLTTYETDVEIDRLRAELAAIKPSIDRQTAEWKSQLDAARAEVERLRGVLATINDDLPAHAQLSISLMTDERDEARRVARHLHGISHAKHDRAFFIDGATVAAPDWLVKP